MQNKIDIPSASKVNNLGFVYIQLYRILTTGNQIFTSTAQAECKHMPFPEKKLDEYTCM